MWPFSSSCRSKARLVGKTVLITGANSGIGKEAARDFYRRGARVIFACRDLTRGKEALEDVKKNPRSRRSKGQFEGEPGELVLYHLNLASLQSVKECAKNLLTNEPAVHILVNNAGVMMCPFEKTEDGFEQHFQVNHLGHFLLTLLLLPKIRTSAPGCRIINVSSTAHFLGDIYFDNLNLEQPYSPLKAYAQSKLANILFTKELATRLEEAEIPGINVYSLHPGVVHTELARHFDKTIFPGITFISRMTIRWFVKNAEQGAETTIHCAVDEEAGKETGLYYAECKPKNPWAKAKDMEKAKKLWDRSCELLDLDPKLNFEELLKEAARKSSIAV